MLLIFASTDRCEEIIEDVKAGGHSILHIRRSFPEVVQACVRHDLCRERGRKVFKRVHLSIVSSELVRSSGRVIPAAPTAIVGLSHADLGIPPGEFRPTGGATETVDKRVLTGFVKVMTNLVDHRFHQTTVFDRVVDDDDIGSAIPSQHARVFVASKIVDITEANKTQITSIGLGQQFVVVRHVKQQLKRLIDCFDVAAGP